MADDRKQNEGKKQCVLLVSVNDLVSVLDDHLSDRIRIILADDSSQAEASLAREEPVLVIVGLDDYGQRLNPFIRTVAQQDIPLIAVARSEKILDEVDGLSWSVDRNRHGAVVSLAARILDDPTYVPNNPTFYPPPPKVAGEVHRTSNTNIQPVKIVSVGPNRPTPTPPGPLGDPLIQRLERDIMSAFKEAIDESTVKFKKQALLLVELQKRIEVLEQRAEGMHSDLGELIDAVAQEGVTFQAEIKEKITALTVRSNSVGSELAELIDSVSSNNSKSIEEVRAALNGLISQLRTYLPTGNHVVVPSASGGNPDADIDALQTAIACVEAQGSDRERSLQTKIDELVEQITKLSSAPPPPSYTASMDEGTTQELVAAFEKRFDALESSVDVLRKTQPGTGNGADFTSEFEVLWGTQAILNKLQQRVGELENRLNGQGRTWVTADELRVITRAQTVDSKRLDAMRNKLETVDATVSDLEHRTEVIARAPQAQFAAFESKIAAYESRLAAIESTKPTIASSIAHVDKVQNTQADMLQRLSALEQALATLAMNPNNEKNAAQGKAPTTESLESRFQALQKLIQNQWHQVPDFNAYIQGFQKTHANLESRLNGLDEAIAGEMQRTPELVNRLKKIQENQTDILRRLNALERKSDDSASIPHSSEGGGQPLSDIREWERTEKRLADLEAMLGKHETGIATTASELEIRAKLSKLEEIQGLMLDRLQQLKALTPPTGVKRPTESGSGNQTARDKPPPQGLKAGSGRITRSSLAPISQNPEPAAKPKKTVSSE